MSSPSIVRPATVDDREEIWRLFRLALAENGLFPMSEAKVEFFLARSLEPEKLDASDTGPRGIIGVIGSVGALEGVIMLVLGSAWYSDAVSLDDAVNFVDPEHRRSNHSKVLIAYAKHIVDAIRSNHPDFKMILGIVSTVRTAAKIRLYERQLTPVGCYFLYPPADEHVPLRRNFRAG